MKKAGTVLGIIFLVLGGTLSLILLSFVASASVLPKILIAGPSLACLGLGMMLFPGGGMTINDLNSTSKSAGDLWSEAPLSHRVAWVGFGGVGLAISFYIIIDAGFM